MADIAIWNGSSTFTTGSTPFGFYDDDASFQADADKVADFCAKKCGYPMMDVELTSGSFYACFEEAVTVYGNEIFGYKIRENYLSLEGSSRSNILNDRVIDPTLSRIVEIADTYGQEVNVGGNVTRYSGSIAINANQQVYDMDQWAINEGITGSIEIRKVFYEAPPAILRYFDPYAGTGTGIQSLMDAFDFGSYSPGINFMLMPTSFDALKIQAIEFNDQIRRSAYSFDIVNNDLRIFPIPKSTGSLWFEYFKKDEKSNPVSKDTGSLVTTVGDVPYNNPTYDRINAPGRKWIFQYAAALAKEMLAYVRGKYTEVPVPDSEVTLNQADLLTDARQEKQDLLENLRDMLDQASRRNQLERKAEETENLNRALNGAPLLIYVG